MLQKLTDRNHAYTLLVQDLLHKMASFDEETLNRQPAPGTWSALQTMHHLILSEELGLKYVQKKLSFDAPIPDAGWRSRWRGAWLWFYLNVPIPFKAPVIVSTEMLPERSTLEATRERWMAVRLGWTEFIKEMPLNLIGKAVYRHPIAGRLGWREMLLFYRFHFERHLKQIWRALK